MILKKMALMKAVTVFAFFTLLSTSIAQAYSPPASFILSKVLKEREKVKTLDLEGRFSSSTSGGVMKEHLHVDFPTGKVIATYSSEDGEPLGVKTTKIQDLQPMGRAWIGIGMDPYGNRMRVTLEDLGVYPQENAEVRIERIASPSGPLPVWVWGMKNQLKILKDEFLFAGYQDEENLIEVQEYTGKSGAIRLPKKVFVRQGGFTYELKGFKLNAAGKANPGLMPIQSEPVREWVELVR